MNRRNAVVGWAAWQIGKRMLKKKARAAMPGVESSAGGRGKGLAAIAALAAAAAGALVFWRKSQADTSSDFSPE